MHRLKRTYSVIFITLFFLVLLLPLLFFNFQPDTISEIDNRKLAEFPLSGDITEGLTNYVNDRLGFRDELITAYTILNDKLFGKMVHPTYTYGKHGYVFFNYIPVSYTHLPTGISKLPSPACGPAKSSMRSY